MEKGDHQPVLVMVSLICGLPGNLYKVFSPCFYILSQSQNTLQKPNFLNVFAPKVRDFNSAYYFPLTEGARKTVKLRGEM